MNGPASDTGTLRLFSRGDVDHTGFNNLAFLIQAQLLVVEDRSDTLHRQRNALDSGFVFDANEITGIHVPKHWPPSPHVTSLNFIVFS